LLWVFLISNLTNVLRRSSEIATGVEDATPQPGFCGESRNFSHCKFTLIAQS
jgi:hypothetical protein